MSPETIEHGFQEFAELWNPILDVFDEVGVRFALEVHPTEIAFDIVTAERALEAVGYRDAFGFNYDPSHLAYQGVDCVAFILRFESRILHAHMKDVWWSSTPMPSGVFGGHLPFGASDRFWDFRSLGRGRVPFEEVIRALNRVGYQGPLSVEWEGRGDGAGARCGRGLSVRARSGFSGIGDRLRRGIPAGRLGAPDTGAPDAIAFSRKRRAMKFSRPLPCQD